MGSRKAALLLLFISGLILVAIQVVEQEEAGVGSRLETGTCSALYESEGRGEHCLKIASVQAYVPQGHLDPDFPLVVIDPGGPGVDPMSPAGTNALGIAGIPNAVIPLEPWVTRPPTLLCQAALSRFMRSVTKRSAYSLTASGMELADHCGEEISAEVRFASKDLAEFVQGIREVWQKDVIYVGVSFGAQRSRAVGADLGFRLLISPFLSGVNLFEDLNDRRARSYRALGSTVSKESLESVAKRLPATIPGRSVPYTSVDLDASLLAAAYAPKLSKEWLPKAMKDLAGGVVDSVEVKRLGVASDYVEGRYGRDQIHPGLIGYIGNMCAQYDDRSPGPDSRGNGLRRPVYLVRLLSLCSWIPADVSSPNEASADGPTCVIYSERDSVGNAGKFLRASVLDPEAVIRSRSRGHVTSTEMSAARRVLRTVIDDGATNGLSACRRGMSN